MSHRVGAKRAPKRESRAVVMQMVVQGLLATSKEGTVLATKARKQNYRKSSTVNRFQIYTRAVITLSASVYDS